LRIQGFYLDSTPVGNPGSGENTIFRHCGRPVGAPNRCGG
jgi:hypothetical protein